MRVRSLVAPGRYTDGNGLYLVVDPSGAKRWVLRVVVRGRRKDIGLGGVRVVTLAEAREKAARFRKVARDGGDPLMEIRRDRRPVPTFAEAAEIVYDANRATWKNLKHAGQWMATLKAYAFPVLGAIRVDQIASAEVLRALGPIWLAKPETARRVRQRIGTILDWAKTAGHRAGENPIAGIEKGLPRQVERRNHHAALPYVEIPHFVRRLRSSSLGWSVSLAFEFLVLTAARTGEVVGARWDEFDLEAGVWHVPAARMKSKKEHRVPLSPRALAVLAEAKAQAPGSSPYVFPGRTYDRPISNMAMLMALRRMGVQATTHGFRSAFRDWAAERTNFPTEVCEAALAHVVKNKVEAAYRRTDLFGKRRQLMTAWAAHVVAQGAEIVSIRAG